MNVSPLWMHFFSQQDIESARWLKIGKNNAPDSQILGYAKENGFVIFTYDIDFGTLLAMHGFKLPSVIQIRSQWASPETHGRTILEVLNERGQELDEGLLITIINKTVRFRKLPIEIPRLKP